MAIGRVAKRSAVFVRTGVLLVARLGCLAGITELGATPAEAQVVESAPGAPLRAEAGEPLVELMRELESGGLHLLWSSELVRPEMAVLAPLAAATPEELLLAALAPHGLTLERRGAALVVVRSPAAENQTLLRGRVLSRMSLEPIAGVEVRLLGSGAEAETSRDGAFEIATAEPGPHRLEARRLGYVIEEVAVPGNAVGEPAASPAAIEILLEPAPPATETVEVQPSRISLLLEQPTTPLALSRQEIETLPQLASDIFRAINLLPGTASNDITAQFHVRGGRRDETLIRVDGQELYDAYHLKDFDSARGLVASSTLSGLSLSTGAFSASSGDRMGGILEMTTLAPAEPRRFRLSLSLLDLQVEAAGRAGGRAGWMFSLRPGSAKLASALFGEEDPDFWDAFAKAEIDLSPTQALRARVLVAGDRLTFAEQLPNESRALRTEYGSSYFWLTHQALAGDRLLVESSGSFSHLDRDRNGFEAEEEKDYVVHDRRDLDVLELAQTWSWALARQSLSAGFDARRYVADYDYESEREFFTPLTALRAEPRDGSFDFTGQVEDETLGAHLLDQFRPSSNLSAELGLRYDRHSTDGEIVWSPRASLAWALGEATVVKLAWGRYSQGQRAYELMVEDGDTRLYPPEISEHWVLGVERYFAAPSKVAISALRLEAYRRETRDPRPRYESLFEPFEPFPEGELDRVRLEPERGLAEGAELLVHGRRDRRVQWWFNYGYARAEDLLGSAWTPRQIDQRHTFNIDLATALGRQWQINLAWRYHSGRPTTPISVRAVEVEDPDDGGGSDGGGGDEGGVAEESTTERATLFIPEYGRLNSQRLEAYHRLDLRLSRGWDLRRGRLTFFADVQNLYNRQNVAGFDVEFDEDIPAIVATEESWPGFLASAGITWEF